jgi:8-oxo-dGTP pyrophosphatase MutT (NUDIX family)
MVKSPPIADATSCTQVAALPWRQDANAKIRILMVTSRTNAKWMLPKGWPMEGKTDPEAALIETQEEAGVDGIVSDRAIGSYRFIKLFDDGTTLPAQALIYPVEVLKERKDWREKGQRTRKWLRPKSAAKLAFEPDLKRFLLELSEETLLLFKSS